MKRARDSHQERRSSWLALALGTAVCAVLAPHARAVTTRHFSLDSASVFSAGKLEGSAVHSDGSVSPSVETRRTALEGVGVARSLLVRPDGSALVGTGNQGRIYRVTAEAVEKLAETGEIVVTSLVAGPDAIVYAATIPHGKIFALDAKGKLSPFATPEGADHVWALVYDAKRKTLFAATGPEGKVFTIDAKGKSEVHLDTDAAHVMSLALDADGTLYAGTDGEALLYRIRAPGRGEVLYDFEGNELTAIAAREGVLAVAANQFPKPTGPQPAKDKTDGKDDEKTTDKTDSDKKTDRPKPGSGKLWRIDAAGRARMLFAPSSGHLTAVEWGEDGVIYAANGKEGAIHRVNPDGTNALWIDVDERQVLELRLTGANPMFTTGDGGAVYRVLAGRARQARWEGKVLDAEFASRWGELTWRGKGKLTFQTRSGNTDKPDVSWSEWSSPLGKPGPIRSPQARFLQIRAELDTEKPAVIYAVTAYYLPQNQPVTLSDLRVAPAGPAKPTGDGASAPKGKPVQSKPTTSYRVQWDVDNPDGDALRYRLKVRREGASAWLPIHKESEILTAATYDWNTERMPDGYCRVRVEATDELASPAADVLRATLESEPFLLDNHPPHVAELRWSAGVLNGLARDSLGPIASLEVTVDAGDWIPFHPEDALFDTAVERFRLPLDLPRGSHVIAVRATDSRDNPAVAELEVEVK